VTYLIRNPNTGEQFEIEDLGAARAKLAEVKAVVLAQEDYRFTVAKELVNGNDTTWLNADLDNDPEDHRYHVFNTFTGQHELFTTLSSAKTRRLELKEQFATDVGLGGEPKEKPAQPNSVGAQDF
jgi:hypothetical protein